jgi:hypothetical protein
MRDAASVTVVDQVLRGDTHTAEFYEALTATSPTDLVAIIGLYRHANPCGPPTLGRWCVSVPD